MQVTRSDAKGRPTSQPPLIVSAWQFLVAMVIFDSWQYFMHRWMHTNKFLYKFHSVHHGLIAPYPMSSIYSNGIDQFLTDIVGGLLSRLITGMTARTSIYFFSLSIIRGVDLHSGLFLPWSPFQLLFGSNSAFHATHHQLGGFQANFSQLYFLFWDKFLGTYAPYSVEKRKEGGYKVRAIKDL